MSISPVQVRSILPSDVQRFECTAAPDDSNDALKAKITLVVGRILQVIAVLAIAASVACAFVATPLTLLGMIPAVAVGLLGSWMTGDLSGVAREVKRAFLPAGRPVGLVNSGQNCWVNSALQFLINIPGYKGQIAKIPLLNQLKNQYEPARAKKADTLNQDWGQAVRLYLSAQNDQISANQFIPSDPMDVLEHVFEGVNGLSFNQTTVNDTTERYEPYVEVNLDDRQTHSFQHMFNGFFNYTVENQQVARTLPAPPKDLLIKSRRYYPEMIQMTDPQGNPRAVVHPMKISDPIQMPEKLILEGRFANSQTDHAYSCDAFILHIGQGASGGHYVTYVKRNNVWWLCNDTEVTRVQEDEVRNAMRFAYIFHYVQ